MAFTFFNKRDKDPEPSTPETPPERASFFSRYTGVAVVIVAVGPSLS